MRILGLYRLPFAAALRRLAANLPIVRKHSWPREYRVNFHEGSPATEYTTDDLVDAGPTGRRIIARRAFSGNPAQLREMAVIEKRDSET
jgi:hypothetical protein